MRNRNLFEMWTWMAPFGFLAMLPQFIPGFLRDKFKSQMRRVMRRLWPYVVCDIPEFSDFQRNSLYKDVQVYISSLKVDGADHLHLSKSSDCKELTYALANDQRNLDTFAGVEVEWVHRVQERQRPMFNEHYDYQIDEKRYYSLHLKRNDRDRMLDSYIQHIEVVARKHSRAVRPLRLYTNAKSSSFYIIRKSGPWQSVPFLHPARFDTIALDGDLKSRLIADLEQFAANEMYYKRVGKAWKRGYLLFGPPGTGKSSMVAAIANKMGYDVYDLELTEVNTNTELRKLLLETTNKSVVVIEDIDCSLDLSGQRKKKKKAPQPVAQPGAPPPKEERQVTLSGLLNFVDGLWSSCGSERIFIFTTNFKEKLDPALLRAGRMDMHIHLGYCTFSAFQTLAKTYLEISEHELFGRLESAFAGSFMTPAEVSEVIIQNQRDGAGVILEKLIEALGEHRVDPATLKNPDDDEEEEEDSVEAKGPSKPPPPPPQKAAPTKTKSKKGSPMEAPVEDKTPSVVSSPAVAVPAAASAVSTGDPEGGKAAPAVEESSEETPMEDKESITISASESPESEKINEQEIEVDDPKSSQVTATVSPAASAALTGESEGDKPAPAVEESSEETRCRTRNPSQSQRRGH